MQLSAQLNAARTGVRAPVVVVVTSTQSHGRRRIAALAKSNQPPRPSANSVTRRTVRAAACGNGSNGHSCSNGSNGNSCSSNGSQGSQTLSQEVGGLPPADVAETLLAYSVARAYDPAVFSTVVDVVAGDMDKYDVNQLISILCACGNVGHLDRPFVAAAAKRLAAGNALADVPPAELANCTWSFALMGASEEDVGTALAALARQAARSMASFPPSDLVRLLSAYAELAYTPGPTFVDALMPRLKQLLTVVAAPASAPAAAAGDNGPAAPAAAEEAMDASGACQAAWALARMSAYERGIFDAFQAVIMPAAAKGALSVTSLSLATWAFTNVRDMDEKHRAIYDVNLLAVAGSAASKKLDVVVPPGAEGEEEQAAGAEPAAPQRPQQTPEPVDAHTVVTMLMSFARVPHHDRDLFASAARLLSKRAVLALLPPQSLVVTAWCYGRVQHSSQPLMAALGDALVKVIDQLDDGDDLLNLVASYNATATYHDKLMKGIIARALNGVRAGTAVSAASGEASGEAEQPPGFDPVVLLELARAVPAFQHHDMEHYTAAQSQLLAAANAAYLNVDMEGMSSHCGSTDPSGMQK